MGDSKRTVQFCCAIASAGLIGAVGFLAFPQQQHSFVMSNGWVLRLKGVTSGTNAFVDGNLLQRVLRRPLPKGGISFLGFRLNPPPVYSAGPQFGEDPSVTAWFQLQGVLPQDISAELKAWGFVAGNGKGRQLECGRATIMRNWSFSGSSAVLFAVPLIAFPRDQNEIILNVIPWRLERGTSQTPEFRIQNRPITGANWEPKLIPITNRLTDVELVLARAGVSTGSFHGFSIPSEAEIRFRLLTGEGSSDPNWEVVHCEILDSEGNRRKWSKRYTSESGFGFSSGLEPNRTWKVEATLARSGAFPTNELMYFHVGTTQSVQVTNSLGTVLTCTFDGKSLSASKAGGWRERPYLEIRSATDEAGKRVKLSNRVWRGLYHSLNWILAQPAISLDVELADPKVIKTEFFVKPNDP